MPWFGVHVVLAVQFKDGIQNEYPAWENVYLVEAGNPMLAEKKAEKIGQEFEGDSKGTFQWNGRPARWVFVGVRKSVEISGRAPLKDEPGDGTEVTYSTLEFHNEQSLRDYARGQSAAPKAID